MGGTSAAPARTTEPCLASAAFLPIPSSPAHPQLEPILGDIRAWYCGIQTEHCNSLLSERAKDAEILSSEASEVDKVAAAYRLGRVGARQLLARALTAEDEGTARAAAYGLTASGPSATASVLPLLTNASNRVRRHAAFVVGETAKPEASTVTALGQALQEDSSKEATWLNLACSQSFLRRWKAVCHNQCVSRICQLEVRPSASSWRHVWWSRFFRCVRYVI